jgi:long-chain fatty acid transport protein
MKVEGDLSFTGVPAGNAPSPPFPAGTPWAAFFAKNPAKGTIGLPATAAGGIAYTGLPGWQFEFDGHWLGWSSFDSLRIDVANANPVVKDRTVYEEWKNTLSWRLGAAWTLCTGHEVRAGAYTENSAIPNRFLRPSIPDADRTGVTVGYGFRSGAFSADAYYLHIMLKDVTVSTSDLDPREPVPVGTYKSTLDLLGVSLGWRF